MLACLDKYKASRREEPLQYRGGVVANERMS